MARGECETRLRATDIESRVYVTSADKVRDETRSTRLYSWIPKRESILDVTAQALVDMDENGDVRQGMIQTRNRTKNKTRVKHTKATGT